MQVTSIRIHPAAQAGSKVQATADVVLDQSLSLRGIKIMRGRYGLFLAFPGTSPNTPHRVYETVSMLFRKQLQDDVLKAYHEAALRTLPLFS